MVDEKTKPKTISEQSVKDATEFLNWVTKLVSVTPKDETSMKSIDDMILRTLAVMFDRAFTEGMAVGMAQVQSGEDPSTIVSKLIKIFSNIAETTENKLNATAVDNVNKGNLN